MKKYLIQRVEDGYFWENHDPLIPYVSNGNYQPSRRRASTFSMESILLTTSDGFHRGYCKAVGVLNEEDILYKPSVRKIEVK